MAAQELAQARARRELELAAEMQGMLIPTDLPSNERIDAAGWYQPHSEVGGDYYDLIALPTGQYVACVADVSGKGIAAALLMSNFQANLRASIPHATDLVQLVHDLNAKVHASARGERFITLFIAHLDLRERRLRFVNAGHNDPLLHDGTKCIPLHDGSIALGMMPKLPFLRTGEVALPEECTLLCYTDGLVEQEDLHGNAFGTEPMERALTDLSRAKAAEVNAAVIAAFEAHRSNQNYLDDIALLTCRFR